MSKTPVKKSATKKTVAVKASAKHVTSSPKRVVKQSNDVKVSRNLLMFLVLTLVAAAVMLVVQAQTNNTLTEQNRANQALQNETEVNQEIYKDNRSEDKNKP